MLHLLYPFLYHLWFSDVFKGYRNETLDKNGLSVNFYFKNSIKFIKKKLSAAQAKIFFHYPHFRKQDFFGQRGRAIFKFQRISTKFFSVRDFDLSVLYISQYRLQGYYISCSELGPTALRENRLNTEFFCSVFSCIWSKYRKIRTKKTPYLDTFDAVLTSKKKECVQYVFLCVCQFVFLSLCFYNKKNAFSMKQKFKYWQKLLTLAIFHKLLHWKRSQIKSNLQVFIVGWNSVHIFYIFNY